MPIYNSPGVKMKEKQDLSNFSITGASFHPVHIVVTKDGECNVPYVLTSKGEFINRYAEAESGYENYFENVKVAFDCGGKFYQPIIIRTASHTDASDPMTLTATKARAVELDAPDSSTPMEERNCLINLEKIGEGTKGNSLKAVFTKSILNENYFNLQIIDTNDSNRVLKNWTNLSWLSTDNNYFLRKIDENFLIKTSLNTNGSALDLTNPVIIAFSGGADGLESIDAADFYGSEYDGEDDINYSGVGFGAVHSLLDSNIIPEMLVDPSGDVAHLLGYMGLISDNYNMYISGTVARGLNRNGARSYRLGTHTLNDNNLTYNSGRLFLAWPWITPVDFLSEGLEIGPSGAVAGLSYKVAGNYGIHESPAGIFDDIGKLQGAVLSKSTAEKDSVVLNPVGVNVFRSDLGNYLYGSRTTAVTGSFKFMPVRRTMTFCQVSMRQGTKWAIHRPNAKETWTQIERSVKSFFRGLWANGVLAGATEKEAFEVYCNKNTISEEDLNNGLARVKWAINTKNPMIWLEHETTVKTASALK